MFCDIPMPLRFVVSHVVGHKVEELEFMMVLNLCTVVVISHNFEGICGAISGLSQIVTWSCVIIRVTPSTIRFLVGRHDRFSGVNKPPFTS